MLFKHLPTGITGEFLKEFKATGRMYHSTVIRLDDGREYVAPSHEFAGIKDIKFIKRDYIMDTVYMKVTEQDTNFYKGFLLSFDKDETRIKSIHANAWLDFKSSGYLITHVSEDIFLKKYNRAIESLKSQL